MKYAMTFLSLLITVSLVVGATLQQAYHQAGPGLGYDRVIFLHPDSTYTGGLTITDEKVAIKGFGALIDLAGDTLYVTGSSQIDLDGCVIINGYAGLFIQGSVVSRVSQCTFYGHQYGILVKTAATSIQVYNTILANNTQYGFACEKGTERYLEYLDAYQNLQGNYVEWCPG